MVTALPALGRAPPESVWHSPNSALQLLGYSFPPLSCIYPHSFELQAIQLSLLHVIVIYCLLITHRMPWCRSSAFQRLGNISYVWGDTAGGCTSMSKDLTFTCIAIVYFIHKSYGHILDLSSLQILNSKVPRNFEVLNNPLLLYPTIPSDLLLLSLDFLALLFF